MNHEPVYEPSEYEYVIRRQNRALRQIVKQLRKTVETLRSDADSKFMMLCDTETNAEVAMRELWESGEFNCGPQDYQEIAKQVINAMYTWRSVKLEQAAPAHCTVPPKEWRCTREPGHSGPCAAIHV